MSWTVGVGAAAPGLLALIAGREVVPAARADVVLWPAAASGGLIEDGRLHVVDGRGGAPRALPGVGLVLAGSAEAFGAWALANADVPIAVVPPVAPVGGAAGSVPTAMHVLGGDEREVGAAAAWAAGRGLAFGVSAGSRAMMARFGAAPPVGLGALVLDLRRGADALEPTAELAGLMAAGAPVAFLADSPLRCAIEAAGAGWRAETVPDGLAAAAAGYAAASVAAQGFAAVEFAAALAQAAFERAVTGALGRQRATAPSDLGPGGHVLVISDEAPNLRHIRVTAPFDALVRAGAIGGYSVLSGRDLVGSDAGREEAARFSAIWVQRSVDPAVHLLLRTLGRPYVYDLDDHLLLSPVYRPAFAADAVETAAALIRDCAVLSCATGRLAAAVGARVPARRGGTVVTPNLAFGPPVAAAGPARTVVWASSDAPALAGSRREIERAVRDFCRLHGLDLLCVGSAPPPMFAAAGLRVEHVGLLPYPAYLARLRAAAPGILVAPLETAADPQTQAFVDCKSDIKVIEAGLTGLRGVFSRAAPYAESALAPAILCDNDYASWTAGLERARRGDAGQASAWPAARDAAGRGLCAWAAAMGRARTDLARGELEAARRFVAAQAAVPLGSPALFDEADYLRRHPDVAEAVAAGVVASGYRHYVQSGFREGRAMRQVATELGDASFWWARLLHRTSALDAAVAANRRAIAALRERMALRQAVPDPPAAPPAARSEGWLEWEVAETRALPCPVCDDPGPHGTMLRAAGKALLRCRGCGTCFYEDRVAHDYAAEPNAGVLTQFALEQNAGIHHQTRLLFGAAATGSVLDVGCGFGFAVDLATRVLGWRAVGVDPSPTAAAGARVLGADIRVAMLDPELDVGPGFDRVIASEVIEHVADPYALLALLRARLVPGGTLALTTPDAAVLEQGADGGRLLGILAPGVHLTLFTAGSLTTALRRAGFAHVSVQRVGDSLVAEASDWPLRAGDPGRHGPAYRAYLETLVDRAEPGGALWNGAAARLLAFLGPTAPLPALDALFARIAETWRDRLGVVLDGAGTPLSEAEIGGMGAAALGRRRPFALASVLWSRAEMEVRRADGAMSAAALPWALAAYRVAVETRRVLQAENMVDLDLKRIAGSARLLALRCLGAMAPALEGALLGAAGLRSPGAAADWDDAPDGALAAAAAPFFVAAVAADRFEEARRVLPFVDDADALAAALGDDAALLLRTLFMRGVLRLVGDRDALRATAAFERLAAEAARLRAPDYAAIAAEHLARLAAS